MEYVKINNVDISKYVNELKVNKKANYNAQTNAAGNTVVDYVNAKREIEVGFIPLNGEAMATIQGFIDNFRVWLSYRNPKTNSIDSAYFIIPSSGVEYYTIRQDNVSYKAFTIKFVEL